MDGIHSDYEAIGRILRETCKAPINAIAVKVAANAAANPDTPDDATVTMRPFTTDRAIAVVRLNHPAGLAIEAKYGILTKAAAAAGLEVHGGGDGLVEYVSKAGHKSRITAKQAANYGGGAK